jgi:hypothetical protein
MMDDHETTPSVAPDPAASADLLVYDLSKFLLTLSLLVMGAVLTLSSTAAERPPVAALLVVIGCLVVSGFVSMSCLSSIVTARHRGGQARHALVLNQIAAGLLGAGVGAFLVVWGGLLI